MTSFFVWLKPLAHALTCWRPHALWLAWGLVLAGTGAGDDLPYKHHDHEKRHARNNPDGPRHANHDLLSAHPKRHLLQGLHGVDSQVQSGSDHS